jgi:serine/threonine protein phosphatase PrpC
MIYTIQDQGMRDYQEDTYDIDMINNFLYIGLFDGHGGDKVSQYLKKNLKNELKKRLIPSNTNISKVLHESLEAIENSIKFEDKLHTGSTALVALKKDNKIYVANVGDCRCIINNKNECVQITEDHNPFLLRELERILKNNGKIIQDDNGLPRVMGTLALTRAIGDDYLKQYITWKPDLYDITLGVDNKIFILASDGLFDVFKNKEIMDKFLNINVFNNDQIYIKNLLHNIIQEARLKGSTDNITLIVEIF